MTSMGIGTGCSEVIKLEEYGVFGGPRLLEVGCGDGRITAQLAQKATCLVAVDPSPNDLMRAVRRVDKAFFCRASGVQLPFPDDSFDTVLFTLSLHHQDSRLALGEAGRVVAPGGRILVMEPAVDGEAQQLFHFFEDETAALSSDTAAGTLLGTMGYMAPEQLRSEPVDVRTDVFAFGCVLYEMLSGRRPFAGGSSAEHISAVLRDEPPVEVRFSRVYGEEATFLRQDDGVARFGEHSGRCGRFALCAEEAGLDYYALDLRGHGRSQGRRGHVGSFDRLLSDLDRFRRRTGNGGPASPTILLGHSLGGLIVGRYVQEFGFPG